jgi:hypothetical protein
MGFDETCTDCDLLGTRTFVSIYLRRLVLRHSMLAPMTPPNRDVALTLVSHLWEARGGLLLDLVKCHRRPPPIRKAETPKVEHFMPLAT